MNAIYISFYCILYFPVFTCSIPPDGFSAKVIVNFIAFYFLQKEHTGDFTCGIIIIVSVNIPCLEFIFYGIAFGKYIHVAIKKQPTQQAARKKIRAQKTAVTNAVGEYGNYFGTPGHF